MKDRLLLLADVVPFALSYFNLVLVWSGIGLWEMFTGKRIGTGVDRTLYFAGFAVLSFLNYRKTLRRARAAEALVAEGAAKASPQREFVKDADSLLQRYGRGGTASELVPELDKWIRVSGIFEGAAESLTRDATFVSVLLESGRRISLRFDGTDRGELRLLREGQRLSAACQVRQGYGEGTYVLDHCELLRSERSQAA